MQEEGIIMNRRKSNSFIIRLSVFLVMLALVGAELIIAAQNSNSSTTMQNDNMSASNMSGTKRRSSRRRRGRRRSAGMSNANSACGPMQENSNTAGSMQENANTAGAMSGNANMRGRRRRGGRRVIGFPAGQTSTDMQNNELERTVGKPEDFTGQSYSGAVNYPEGSLSGPAKLEFMADNQFSLTPESGQAMTGRYTAVTTRGYTGVTMMFGKWEAAGPGVAQPALLPTISLTAKKAGGDITLMSAPGEKREFSFTSSAASGGSGKGRRHSRGGGRPIKVGIKPPTVRNHRQGTD
jgi:hypothetical protein